MQLDRTQPFAEIIGQAENGARYSQHGRDFDANGQVIEDQPAVALPTEPKKRGRPAKDKNDGMAR